VLSSYKFDDYLDAKLGVVNGSNSDNNTTTSNNSDGCAVLAALNVTAPGGNANWSNNFQYSSNNDNNTWQSATDSSTSTAEANGSSGTGYSFIYNSWGNWAPKFANDKLLLAFNALLGTESTNNNNPSQPGTTWFGAGAYAKYQFNDWFSLASRGEYLGGNNPEKLYNTPYNNTTGGGRSGLSLWEYTITAGFNVIDNLLIRAEYRLDWGDGSVNNFNTANNNTTRAGTAAASTSSGPAHYAGAEVVYSF